MEKLLENQNLRKLTILFELSLDLSPQNINALAMKLNISVKTLLSTFDEINHDAILYKQDAKIEKYSRNEVVLNGSRNFSIFQFKLKYIQNSILYQFLDSAFNSSYSNIQDASEAYYISTASLYRKLSPLKEILKAFDLDFENQNNFLIKGNEKQIRFFFFNFYSYSCKNFEWHFHPSLKEICSILYDEIFMLHFSIHSPIMREKIILLLAINLIRKKSGYILKAEEVSEMTYLTESNPNFIEVKKEINQTLLTYGYSLEDASYTLIFCLMVCDEDYSPDIDFNFLSLVSKKRTAYEETTILFLQILTKFLKRPLDSKEYYQLHKNLLKINMHAQFFTEKMDFFTPNKRFDYIKKYYFYYGDVYKKFYSELLKHGKQFQELKRNPNLYDRYLFLLIENLDIRSFHPEINIAFLLDDSTVASLYQQKIQSFTLSPIKFSSEIMEDTDFIISNNPLQLDTNIDYYILNTPATAWEWDVLKKELDSIRERKLQKRLELYI